jgi:GNAT superfamily N-acetyltransferase
MPAVASPPDPRVRRAVRDDIPALAPLDHVLDDVLSASPVFSKVSRVLHEETVKEWEEAFDDGHAVFAAEIDGRVVGTAIGLDVTGSSTNIGVMRPVRAGFLGFAAVLPEGRGRGLGRSLGQAVTTWATDEGYPTVCTDWRSANLGAARTWPTLGYQPTFLRLHRQLAG